MNLQFIGNCFFLIGSVIFTFDTGVEVMENLSLRSLQHLLTGLLFTTGTFFFLSDFRQELKNGK